MFVVKTEAILAFNHLQTQRHPMATKDIERGRTANVHCVLKEPCKKKGRKEETRRWVAHLLESSPL